VLQIRWMRMLERDCGIKISLIHALKGAADNLTIPQDVIASLLQRLVRHSELAG